MICTANRLTQIKLSAGVIDITYLVSLCDRKQYYLPQSHEYLIISLYCYYARKNITHIIVLLVFLSAQTSIEGQLQLT